MLKPGTYNFGEITYPITVYDSQTDSYTTKTHEKLVIRSQKGASSTIIDETIKEGIFNYFLVNPQLIHLFNSLV